MADTYGLMKTRKEWTEAVANGETALTHEEWYKKKMLENQVAKPQPDVKPTLAKLSIG